MARVVTIHQPNYLPWIGLFSKIMQADCFIIYDNAQYTTGGVIHRNKIRTRNGWLYLTVPVSKHLGKSRICDVPLPEEKRWRKDHWRTIYQNYVRSPFFKDYGGFFKELYQQSFELLCQLNEKILLYVLNCFGIKVEVIKASEMKIDPVLRKTDLMLAYLKCAGADIYLSGPSGRNYLEAEKFPQNNMGLKYFAFQHPVYQQRYPGFEPNLSAIDLLFNEGPAACQLIKKSGLIEDG